jgi:hypothetical protein
MSGLTRASFAMRQELSNTLSERLERRYRDEWIDNQNELNVIVASVTRKDPSLRHIKILQNFHGALDISHFLDALTESSVESVAFVGINMDEEYSMKLSRAISSSGSALSCLQLCRIIPSGLSTLCPALSTSQSLKEARLTFNHDLSPRHIRLLMKSLAASQSLEVLKLFCVDLQSEEATKMLAEAVLSARSLTDVRITSCNLTNISSLAVAIEGSSRLTRVDFSMNRISDLSAVARLWECTSITFLNLSQNELGAEELTEAKAKERARYFDCLANNTTLKKMHLDMNPISPDHAELLVRALEKNTTLMRLGLLTLTVSKEDARRIRYLISLNSAGRGGIQRGLPDRRLMPHLLSRVSKEPHLVYGLLTQNPTAWL